MTISFQHIHNLKAKSKSHSFVFYVFNIIAGLHGSVENFRSVNSKHLAYAYYDQLHIHISLEGKRVRYHFLLVASSPRTSLKQTENNIVGAKLAE